MEYKDPEFDTTAELLPLQLGDLQRILESAAAHIHKLLGISLVPYEHSKVRWHLGWLGYKNKIPGFNVRPQFHELSCHCNIMRQLVSAGTLGFPVDFRCDRPLTRFSSHLDSLSFQQRYLNLRRARNQVNKYGTMKVANSDTITA